MPDSRTGVSFYIMSLLPSRPGVSTASTLSGRPPLKRRLGDAIRRHRRAANRSQEAFADLIEMHRAQYGFVERGKRDLRLSTLERIAEGLGQPLWVLLRDAEDLQLRAETPPLTLPDRHPRFASPARQDESPPAPVAPRGPTALLAKVAATEESRLRAAGCQDAPHRTFEPEDAGD